MNTPTIIDWIRRQTDALPSSAQKSWGQSLGARQLSYYPSLFQHAVECGRDDSALFFGQKVRDELQLLRQWSDRIKIGMKYG